MAISEKKLTTFEQLELEATRVKAELDKKANAADVYTKVEVDAKTSSAYIARGSVLFANLPAAEEANVGDVYNVSDAFTTDETFLEGAGKSYPAGTNVTIVKAGDGESAEYKHDALAGFVDTSNFVTRDGDKVLSDENYSADEKNKLAGIAAGATKVETSETLGNVKINGVETPIFNVASDEQVNTMLDGVFGTASGGETA